jgi:hypothetical protein
MKTAALPPDEANSPFYSLARQRVFISSLA